MKITLFQVDAFTEKLFGGNPAAVCPLAEWLDTETMQNIAMENNLSETAFFVPKGKEFEIRWFTPASEIDLAGHPTLATAHVIFNHTDYTADTITFHSTHSGKLEVFKENNRLILDFPSRAPEPVDTSPLLVQALGAEPVEVLKYRDLMAVFKDQESIENISPNFDTLLKLDTHGIIVTAPGKEADFVSRFFAPAFGVNEDPVTGSAHTQLIPFWAERLKKNQLHALQLSKRKGELFCHALGDRVQIGGTAVTYLIGTIDI